jgi:DNA modification methylase
MNIINQEIRPKWALYNADCVEVVASLPDESVGYSVFSPPFASLYTYSDSPRDMGNSRTYEEFAGHFGYLAADLFRVTKPGRLVSFHCANIPLMKERDGVIGLRDFRGDMIRWFQAAGFIYHSEVTIWKDPVIEMQRTKSLGLLHKQIKKDSCRSRMGNPDYVVTMRKDGENFEPVSHTNETFPVDQWQKWASPVWMDIDQGNTLSYMQARDSNDERHICPLQLDVIERCIELWSNPGDVVLSPFAGIGSEGYVAVTRGRRFIGVELKPSYYEVAVKNLRAAEMETERVSIFDIA